MSVFSRPRPYIAPPGWVQGKVEMTTGTEVPAGCLGLQGFSGPGSDLKRPVRNAHRWRLQICADYVRRLSGCLLTFARPVETGTPPPKHTPMRLGGGEGNRTPVQNASRLPELQPCRQYGGFDRGFQGKAPGKRRNRRGRPGPYCAVLRFSKCFPAILHTCSLNRSHIEYTAVMSTKPALILCCALAVLSGCNSEPEDTRPGQPVAHRRAAFKEIIKVFEPMGVMMRTDTYDAGKFKTLAEQLIARRDVPWQYFTADTLYPPTHARAEVWTEAEKFAADKKAFFDATDTLARVVETPDEATARRAYKDVEAACENCHKSFKRR